MAGSRAPSPKALSPALARMLWSALVRGELAVTRAPGLRIRAFRLAPRASPRAPLAPEDARVALWASAGWANKEIAAALGTSSTSAARAITRVAGQLGLRHRLDAALLVAALEHARASRGPSSMTCVARAPNGVILLFVDLAASPAWTRLTSREQTIVALAVAGWPARRIAKHGHERSARTVENQLARVFRKLGISGRAQLLAHLFSRAATSSISSVRAAVRQ